MPYYNLQIPSSGYSIKFPDIQPGPTNLVAKQMTVGANPNNSAPISFTGQSRLYPGQSQTIATGDPNSLWLSGAPGDGCGIQY